MDSGAARTTWGLLQRCATDHPGRAALVLPDESLAYGELHERAWGLAAALEQAGVGPGDRVAIAVHNSTAWVVWFHALGRLGAVTVPVDPRAAGPELGSALVRSGAVAVLAGDSCAAAAAVLPGLLDAPEAVLRIVVWDGETPAPPWATPLPDGPAGPRTPPPGPDDPAIIQYTSGSTAAPKGAVLAHRAVTAVARGFAGRLDLAEGDRLFSGSPFFHVGGTVLLLATAAVVGGTAVALRAFDAEAALRIVERERCVLFSGVEPHFLLTLAAEGFAPSRLASVRKATSTGPAQVLQRVAREMRIPGLVALYGLSETASNLTMCSVHDPESRRLETCGYPHDETEVAILRPGGDEPVPPGAVGEIVARGVTVMQGYWEQPDETAAAFTADGWLRTGDLGSIGADGMLRFAGRVKDTLRVGGENVSTAEVEQVLLGLPEVAQAAVVGRPHPRLGEVPVAFVTLGTGADRDGFGETAAARLAERLSSFKRPREVTVLDEMPLTGSGKVHKPTLRERLGPAGAGSGAGRDPAAG